MNDEYSSASSRLPEHMLAHVRLGLRVYATAEMGSAHSTNEDAHAVTHTADGGQLLIVCDGSKGPSAAVRASDFLAERLQVPSVSPSASIRDALVRADAVLREELGERPATTAAVVLIHEGWAHIAWVGDSRVYVFRDGKVLVRTRDHRMLEDMVESGSMTREEALLSPMAKLLSRQLGGPASDEPVRPSLLAPLRLQEHDVIVVCSDALPEAADDDAIAVIAQGEGNVSARCEQLVDLAMRREKYDDVSVVVAECAGVRADETLLGRHWDPQAAARVVQPDYDSDLFDLSDLDQAMAAEDGGRGVAWLGIALGLAVLLAGALLTGAAFTLLFLN